MRFYGCLPIRGKKFSTRVDSLPGPLHMYFPEESPTVSDLLGTVIPYDQTCKVFAGNKNTYTIDLPELAMRYVLALIVYRQMTLFFPPSLFLPPARLCQTLLPIPLG